MLSVAAAKVEVTVNADISARRDEHGDKNFYAAAATCRKR